MLKCYPRRRMPTDGTWVKTEASLDGIVRHLNRHASEEDRRGLPMQLEGVWVPIWVKLVPHKGQATPQNPEAIYYHPIIRIHEGTEEIELWSEYVAGLSRDGRLDGIYNHNHFHYHPLASHYACAMASPPGEDTSIYGCSLCEKEMYRDDLGRSEDNCATIFDGTLVCRNCEVPGATYSRKVEERLDKIKNLCVEIKEKTGEDLYQGFSRQWDFLTRTSWGNGAKRQSRVFLDCKWSFYWVSFAIRPNKPAVRDMNGGLIMHGPVPVPQEDGTHKFVKFDYELQRDRGATIDEIKSIHWSIHT